VLSTRKSKMLYAAGFAVAIVAAVLTGPPTHAAVTGQNIIGAALPGHAVTAPSLAGLTMSRAAATGERFSLQNVHSEKCITSDGKDDTTAAQYACNGDSDQTWHLGGSRSGYYQIRNDATNQCLGIAGGSLSGGAHAVVWNCGGTSHPDQYWTMFNANATTDSLAVQNLNSQLVLQVKGNSDANWATVIQEPYDDMASPNQYWWFTS
jgi:Ricin-type beta-trefoil lectin domain-like